MLASSARYYDIKTSDDTATLMRLPVPVNPYTKGENLLTFFKAVVVKVKLKL